MKSYIKVIITLCAYFLQGSALECYQCDSETDKDCVIWNDQIKTVTCQKSDGETCVSAYIKDKKETVRGCKSEIADLPSCTYPHCITCNEDNCNSGIIPEDRPVCYQCDSKTDPKCKFDMSKDAKPKTCENYVFRGKCFTAITEDLEEARRGCDSPNNPICAKGSNFKCSLCDANSKTGCNVFDSYKSSSLSCYSCSSDNEECAWYMIGSEIKPRKCSKPVVLDEKEDCYTYEKDGKVDRGCLLDLPKDDPMYQPCKSDKEECTICSENECNAEKSPTKFHSCYKCRSTADGEKACVSNVKLLNPQNCYSPFQRKSDMGCYSLQLAGDTIRGCTFDMPQELVEQCKHEGKFCKKCDTDICNDYELTPRNSAIKNAAVLCMLLITTSLCYVNYF